MKRLVKCQDCLGPKGPWCDRPETFLGMPIGQFHCVGCGTMQLGGIPHLDCEECGGTGIVLLGEDGRPCPKIQLTPQRESVTLSERHRP